MKNALGMLLAGLDEDLRARIAPALADRLGQLAESCRVETSDPRRLHAPSATQAATRTIEGHLQAPLTAGTVLVLATILPPSDRRALIGGLLLHPDRVVREQTLDALFDPSAAMILPRGNVDDKQHGPTQDGPTQDGPAQDGPAQCGAALSPKAVTASGLAATSAPSLVQALRTGAHQNAVAILAERARLPIGAVEQAIRMRDARMLVSLCWKAGCDAAETLAVETQLGRISPDHSLRVGPGPSWPVPPAVMEWSLGILQEML